MNTIKRNRFAAMLVVLALAGMTGCSLPKAGDWKPSKLFSLDSTWPWKNDDEPRVEAPGRVVGMWTDTVLHKAGEKPQRGFGGRLMFYGKDANKPVLVDGELVVYAFDEKGREPTDNKPTRRYVFPADQLPLHQSKAPVGASYSFWLPWDEAGGPQTEVSLICRFEPKGGAVVTSEQTRHLLPGSLAPDAAVAGKTAPKLPEGVPSRPAFPQLSSQAKSVAAVGGAQLASYEVPDASVAQTALARATADDATPPRHMTTTSITLPDNFQIPNGAARVPAGATSPAMRQNLPPAQQTATPMNVQQQAPSGAVPVPPAHGAKTPSGPTHIGRASTAYQPQPRATPPAVYNPTYASAPGGHGFNQPLPTPTPVGLNPPTIVQPQFAPQPAQMGQQLPHQPPQQQIVGQPMAGPQTAQQPMQIPTSGTATVSYR